MLHIYRVEAVKILDKSIAKQIAGDIIKTSKPVSVRIWRENQYLGGNEMKKLIVLILASAITLSCLAGCTTTPATTETTAAPAGTTTAAPGDTTAAVPADTTAAAVPLTGTLKIWSFTNELQTHALAFQKANPDVKVEYTEISMTNGEFQTKVKAAALTDDVPDCVALEASFVREWVESDLLADLSSLLPKAQEMGTYQNTIDVGTYDGEVRALSYQTTPGAVFYRRSLATEYFGTDDPAKIQALMGDMTKFQDMAKVVKEKSAGNTYMVASTGDFTNLFYANREQPWIVDDAFVIDPMVDQLMDMAKTFRTEGYEAQATQWQEGWFAGMNDSLVDAGGSAKQVFCYFLPTWGLPYVLMQNAGDTAGDWACINGPLPYQWGGTWVGAMKTAKSPELAKAFAEFVALDETNLTNWATGVYTNEYLKAIDPSIGELVQNPGDFVSSKVVVDKITASFDNSDASKFLGGENSYSGFAAAAPNVSARLMQGSDDAIQRSFNDPLENFVSGKMTKEEAVQAFKDAVQSEFPEIAVS